MRLAYRVGYWSSILITALGLAYFLLLVMLVLTGGFVMPPPELAQVLAAVVTLLAAPFLIALMACINRVTPDEKKVMSELGLAFTVLFAGMVSINRFVQLAVVRQSILSGNAEELQRFMPYDSGSAMFALEILGWGLFLGLATLAVAPVFDRGRLQLAIRWLLVLYGVLGITSALAYVAASPLISVGFAAWGVILYLATALLAVFFKRAEEADARAGSAKWAQRAS